MERRPEELLEEQVAYYRARAPEYDHWWERTGPADRGAEHRRRWFAEREELEAALARFGATGQVLELAAGTGNWTRRLVGTAAALTVVDTSPEVLAVNRAKLGSDAARVTYVEADLFGWEPAGRFDVVFFGFWLSHVPPALVPAFWDRVGRALAPGGRVFLVDSLRSDDGSESASSVDRRTLEDGRTFDIVKRSFEPAELRDELATLGWDLDVRSTGESFVYGWGGPAPQ